MTKRSRWTYQEGTTERDDAAVCSQTIHNRTHGVLTDAIADINALIITKTRAGGLEVNTLRDLGQVGPSQVRTATNQLRELGGKGREHGFAQLARGDGRICRLVHRESLLPAVGQFTRNTASEFGVFFRVPLLIRREESVPIRFELGALLADEIVDLLYFGRNKELLLREAPLLFKLLDIISLESCEGISSRERQEGTSRRTGTVDTMSPLYKGAIADDSAEPDKSWLVLLLLCLGDSIGNRLEVTVTIVDVENLPTVGKEPLLNVFSKCDSSVAIDRDV